MDYKAMWEELKAQIKEDLEYYTDGTECSMMEAVNGALNCTAMLITMGELEAKYKNITEDF